MPLPLFVSETLHHEAIDWAKRVSDNGGTISSSVIRAVSAFCAAADSTGPGGFRSAIYRLNLFCGGNLSGALVPLYRGPTFGGTTFGNATDTNTNFVGADFVETGVSGGLKGNGTNKYLQTGFTVANLPTTTSSHMSVSATGLSTSGSRAFMGASDGGSSGAFFFYEHATFNGTGRSYRQGSFGTGQFPLIASPATEESHIIGTRTSATASSIYRSGSLTFTNTTSVSPAAQTFPVPVFALNNAGSIIQHSAGTFRIYSVGTGLNATQAAAFSAAVIQFNTALGR
jgi:hypothetical protein